jgi:hypothetical protein
MSKELIENLLEYADIAEAGEKSHWAKAMRQAAEYIMADLDRPLPEPVAHMFPSDLKHFETNEAAAQAFSVEMGRPDETTAPLYAEPQARKPLSDDDIRQLAIKFESIMQFARAIEKAHGIKEQE